MKTKIKFQVMRVVENGFLESVVPVRSTTFDNFYDANSLAYELSKVTKDSYTVRQIFR